MAEKITLSMKKKITNDWKELYPEMGIYKPMWLMNILGPLVVGLLLHIKSNKDRYIPTLHMHNLAEEFPVCLLYTSCRYFLVYSYNMKAIEIQKHLTIK